jgi:hypothetical protein
VRIADFVCFAEPAVYGQPVTLTATVPSGTTGSATFYEEPATPISGAVPLSGNTAQTNVTLPAGSYSVYANVGNSSTNHLPLVVQKASTTTALSVAQDRLSMTATVTAVAPGSGTPTGTVQFVDHSGNIIGTAPLVAAQGGATATLQVLAFTGSYAVYTGDANFNGSSSTPVTLSPPAGGLGCNVNTTNTPILRSEA